MKMMCRVLATSESGYYAWCKREPTHRQLENERLTEQIRQAYDQGRQVYGSPRVCAPAAGARYHLWEASGSALSGDKLVCKPSRNDTAHAPLLGTIAILWLPICCNAMRTASAPNRKWLTDITAIWTAEGWLYLAVVLDVYSRLIVGWAMASHRQESLVEDALVMALDWRKPADELLHHSDRGSQYTSLAYQAVLTQFQMQVSMSKKGDCYDTAMMESFFSSLKTECVDRHIYQSRSQAKRSVFEWIEVFYNRQRRHSSLAYVSPVAYEQQGSQV